MSKYFPWLIIVIFLGYGVAWSPAVALAQGQEIFNDKCASCHGQDGSGNGPVGSVFSPPPANFTSPGFWQGQVKQKITSTIENGHGPMPAVPLSPTQITAVIHYMQQTFKP